MKIKFNKHPRFNTAAIYTVLVVIVSAIFIKLILNWSSTSEFFLKFMKITSPFMIGVFIAYLINPLYKFLDYTIFKKFMKIKTKKIRKILSIIISYLLVFSLLASIIMYLVPQLIHSVWNLKAFITSAQSGFNDVISYLNVVDRKNPEWDLNFLIDSIENIPKTFKNDMSHRVPNVIPTIYTTAVAIISGIFNITISLIVSLYMLYDKNRLVTSFKRLIYSILKKETADSFIETLNKCNSIFGRFVIGKTVDSAIVGMICWIVLSFLHFPHALIISVIVGITNVIPYFGPFVGAIPGVLLLLLFDYKYAILFVIIIIIIQQFDGLLLGPKILGESTGLRPIWIIFAIVIGGWVGGPIGMFLGVPVVAVISYLTDNALNQRLKDRNISFYTDEDTDTVIVTHLPKDKEDIK